MDFVRRQCGAARIYELADALSVQVSKREDESQLTKEAISTSNVELQTVISHILAGEGGKAERALRAHIKRVGKLVLASMPAGVRAR